MKNENQHTRLNYIIPVDVESKLSDYCAYTGRSSADVIRQLIVEYIESNVTINSRFPREVTGKRTNLTINGLVLKAFDSKTTNVGTRSAVIAKLLNDYLTGRLKSNEQGSNSYVDSKSFKLLTELVTACEGKNSTNNSGDAVVEANYWRALYACRVFLDKEVELDVC